jgi:hypothetical protein
VLLNGGNWPHKFWYIDGVAGLVRRVIIGFLNFVWALWRVCSIRVAKLVVREMKGVNFGVRFHLGIQRDDRRARKGESKEEHTRSGKQRSSEDTRTKTSQSLELAPKERRSKEEEDKGKERTRV